MIEANPFASPQSDLNPQRSTEDANAAWRMGNLLVLRKKARLPFQCIKTGGPASKTVRKHVIWQPNFTMAIIAAPMIGLVLLFLLPPVRQLLLPLANGGIFLLFVPLIVLVVAAVTLQRRAKVDLPVSASFLRSRLVAQAMVVLASVGAAALCYALDGPRFIVFSVIAASVLSQLAFGDRLYIVKPARITKQYVYLKNIHPDYLTSLPAWPSSDFI